MISNPPISGIVSKPHAASIIIYQRQEPMDRNMRRVAYFFALGKVRADEGGTDSGVGSAKYLEIVNVGDPINA